MADALLDVVCSNLNILIQKEFELLRSVDKEMEKLSSNLSAIQRVLEDAEEREVKENAVSDWLRKLKDAAYDADDILDECTTKALEAEVESGIGSSNDQVCSSYLSLCFYEQIMFRHKMGYRIKEIGEKLEAIASERSKFHFREVASDRRTTGVGRPQTDSFLAEPKVYGRDDDIDKVVRSLVTKSDQEGVSIYPITGMGGVGKTTLAQLAYNDETVQKHFGLKIWVCVSEDFEEPRLVKAILESISRNVCNLTELDAMKLRLHEELNGKRFLLVLDDVWNEDAEKWRRVKHLLTCGANGSTIIVTSRLETVASIMGTVPAYNLSGLSEDHCWSLFKQRAFGDDTKEEEHHNLIEIGKEIVKKCGGVPLAAKALGSMLRFKRKETQWLLVKESEIWNLKDENVILSALRLSYNHLPSHSKRCFAYCSVFPKDYEYEKEQLIHLWMANGFISSESEDIGDEIFNDLLWRSFFQDVQKDDDGNIIKCKMHDLMHDLARSVMKDECYIAEARRDQNVPKKIRHSSLISSKSSLPPFIDTLHKPQPLRTLIMQGSYKQTLEKVLHQIFSHCRCLRVLDLSGTEISNLSHTIGDLIHLRYLNLSNSGVSILPESISSLLNLQALILRDCYSLSKLPNCIMNIRSLRHLEIDAWNSFNLLKNLGIKSCIKLRTLSGELDNRFARETLHIEELIAFESELRNRSSLSSLWISDCKSLMSLLEGRMQGLCSSLRYLYIQNCDDLTSLNEGLQYLTALQYLAISECPKMTFLPVAIDRLTSLQALSICFCPKLAHLPEALQQVTTLQHIRIEGCPGFTALPEWLGSHGSLRSLWILDCHNLMSWPGSLQQHYPGNILERILIKDCPNLERLCALGDRPRTFQLYCSPKPTSRRIRTLLCSSSNQ